LHLAIPCGHVDIVVETVGSSIGHDTHSPSAANG
jgi:hypothetical protein